MITVFETADGAEPFRCQHLNGSIRIQGPQQHKTQPAVFHHRSQRRHTFLTGTQAGDAEPGTTRDMHSIDLGGVFANGLAQPQLIQHPQCTGRQGGAARIKTGRQRRLFRQGKRMAFHQSHGCGTVVTQQQRQQRPGHATADDKNGILPLFRHPGFPETIRG